MANYVGARCPVCNKKFSSKDDIVVCPICGAPHHRECYARENVCAFAADHLSGKEWRPPQSEMPPEPGEDGDAAGEAPSDTGTKACPACGGANPAENIFCQVCGQRLFKNEQTHGGAPGGGFGAPGMGGFRIDPTTLQYGGLKPDQEIDGVTVRELAAYVGPNTMYYLPRFAAIDRSGSPLSPNFSSFFLSFLYFFYRKMYKIGTLLLLLFVVSMVPMILYTVEVMPQVLHQMGVDIDPTINMQLAQYYARWVNVSQSVSFVVRIGVAMFANRLYYAKVMRSVRALRDQDMVVGQDAVCDQLGIRGGVNKTLAVVIGLVVFFGLFAVMSVLSNGYV